ncbi:acyclic terpene utilization AtuA family protein [Nocardiopsis umidischolae]|uniref:Acyclic terpene utilization AtuA family protein n=2 Tax=Nocardiopsis tropica TaxID=109330 RepID=A0ABU7KZ25_9ACTN|nr:acyclic terpene utilization AtuA family protein [Nocardiopsis umidischolae]MEE2054555.1 acyclic terpene utilization AtuA family protein [Nocardiopsis umidischolae]
MSGVTLVSMTATSPLRVANASGFYGDRFAAVHEMLTGGPVDVLTGDYLAELTMAILGRDQLADPGRGYARTFLGQMRDCLTLITERRVRVVTNAGGLNPRGLADRLTELADGLGLDPRIACVTGDDLLHRAEELDLGSPLTANAYLGAFGIAACLDAGADIVVTGRVTDASLTVGPAVSHFGWTPDDLDALAGATAAGHVIECGAQATGGNYAHAAALLREGHDLDRPGFPIAEIGADGSAVVTKHPGTGGAVTTGTVTAQLVYEIAGARYPGPDVTTRLDTVRLAQEGPDRVRISGTRGEPPPAELKVGLTGLTGFRNDVEFLITGLDAEDKAALAERQMRATLAHRRPEDLRFEFVPAQDPHGPTQDAATARLRVTARDHDASRVGRAFGAAAVELALAGYAGFHLTSPPRDARPDGVAATHALVPAGEVEHTAILPDGARVSVAPAPRTRRPAEVPEPPLPPPLAEGTLREAPLGLVLGARSGDKGADANLGVWAADDDAWRWLAHTLTVPLLRELLPETAGLVVTRHLLPNLRAANFWIEGVLAPGSARREGPDPQAKGLGEWLRARRTLIPEKLLPEVARQ